MRSGLVHEVVLDCPHDVLALLVGYEPDVDLWCWRNSGRGQRACCRG